MATTGKEKLLYAVAGVGAVVVVWLMFQTTGTATAAPTAAQSAIPATSFGGMYDPPTSLANPSLAASINVNFTPLDNTNAPTGYVPLFGFIGYGGQWN
jgi:hypothetical protein